MLSWLRWLLLVVLLCACKREPTTAAEPPPALPLVTDATTTLVFTWIDDKGDFHRETKVADVPEPARELVRVLDPDREPPAGQIFLADLRRVEGAGYPVRLAPRSDFEKIAATRRGDKAITEHPPVPFIDDADAAVGPAAPPPRPVIIYGAEWCGPCHQAQAYLRRKQVPFVDKDIDTDPAAAKEMQAKLTKAGMRGGSIPVIDVRGKLLIGFDARAIDRALAN